MRVRSAAIATAVLVLASNVPPVHVAPVSAADVSAHVRSSPIEISLALSIASAAVGHRVQVQTTVSNLTRSALASLVVELRVDVEGLRIKPSDPQSISVKAGKDVSVRWLVCGVAPGSYVIVARATVGDQHVDSPARLLTVVEGSRKPAC